MENIEKLVRARRSVRSLDGTPLTANDRERLASFAAKIENPYEIPVRFSLLDAKDQGLSSPVIVGTDTYIAGAVRRIPHAEEAFGYAMETLVLYAQSLGIGTTWIGGTMDRAAFERAMRLSDDERMPCVTPVGYPAAKMSVRETMMRKGVKADWREDFEKLFFADDFSTPLYRENAGIFEAPLEAVRLAPSAVNKQPWRLIVRGDTVHFYEKKSKGFLSDAVGDMQKIDLGIALCNFALVAQEHGLRLTFQTEDPKLPCAADTEYIASFRREA